MSRDATWIFSCSPNPILNSNSNPTTIHSPSVVCLVPVASSLETNGNNWAGFGTSKMGFRGHQAQGEVSTEGWTLPSHSFHTYPKTPISTHSVLYESLLQGFCLIPSDIPIRDITKNSFKIEGRRRVRGVPCGNSIPQRILVLSVPQQLDNSRQTE